MGFVRFPDSPVRNAASQEALLQGQQFGLVLNVQHDGAGVFRKVGDEAGRFTSRVCHLRQLSPERDIGSDEDVVVEGRGKNGDRLRGGVREV